MCQCVNDVTLPRNCVKVMKASCRIFSMMKRKIYLKILLGIVTLVLLIKFLTIVFVEPWVRERINAELNEENRDYLVEIDKVHILMIRSGIELESIKIYSREEHGGERDLNGEIASIKFKGINLAKAIFKNDIYIREVTISNSSIKGKIPFSREAIPPIVSPLNIRIGRILFDKIDLAIENTSNCTVFFGERRSFESVRFTG